MPLGSIRELEAVNAMLATIGSAPVSSFNAPSVDVTMARNTLTEVLRMTQIHGWKFNTRSETRVPAEIVVGATTYSNVINLGNQVMLAEAEDIREPRNVTLIGNPPWEPTNGQGLYDLTNNTWNFASSIKLKLVYALDFDQMPMAARHYVTVRASRMFQDRVVGSDRHHAFTLRDEMMALAMLKRYESETRENSIFENWDVARVIHRQYPNPGYTL